MEEGGYCARSPIETSIKEVAKGEGERAIGVCSGGRTADVSVRKKKE